MRQGAASGFGKVKSVIQTIPRKTALNPPNFEPQAGDMMIPCFQTTLFQGLRAFHSQNLSYPFLSGQKGVKKPPGWSSRPVVLSAPSPNPYKLTPCGARGSDSARIATPAASPAKIA